VASVVALLIALFGSMRLFAQLRIAFDRMWNIPRAEAPIGIDVWTSVKWGLSSFGRDNLAAFLMVIAVGALLVASLALSSALTLAGGAIAPRLRIDASWLHVAEYALSVGLITVLFALVYRVLPRTPVGWKDVWVGAMITALLFTLGRALLGVYFSHASPGSAYGAAGSVVAFLIWANMSLQLMLFGAEFTHVWTYTHGSRAEDS
jgi:membrane protein